MRVSSNFVDGTIKARVVNKYQEVLILVHQKLPNIKNLIRMSNDAKDGAKDESSRALPEPQRARIMEVLPKNGLVYSETGALSEVLCKPKILPIKTNAMRIMEERAQGKLQEISEREENNTRSEVTD